MTAGLDRASTVCNQLRAHLDTAFPAAVGLFAELDSPVNLAFLAQFDCQDRADWLSPQRLAAGNYQAITFRWAADKQLRDAVCDFAADSRKANPWAAKLYNDALARGKDHPHATRIPARAWLYVIWHCWQDGLAYEPARHGGLQRLLKQDQQVVA